MLTQQTYMQGMGRHHIDDVRRMLAQVTSLLGKPLNVITLGKVICGHINPLITIRIDDFFI